MKRSILVTLAGICCAFMLSVQADTRCPPAPLSCDLVSPK